MRTSIPRLRSVRFKGGGHIVLVKTSKTDLSDRIVNSAHLMLDSAAGHRIAGYAMVAWDADGTSWSTCRVGQASAIPSVLVPDFVRNKLLAQRIEDWTIESINEG